MRYTKHNYKTDLPYVETFCFWDSSGNAVAGDIPADGIDFDLVYRAEDIRTFKAGRKGGVYTNCKPLNDSSLEVAIPLSRHSLGKGELIHELILHTPDGSFPDNIQQSCIPNRTGISLWDGPSDHNDTTLEGKILLPVLYRGSNYLLDLTTYTYPETGKKVAAEIANVTPFSLFIRVSVSEPLRYVVQIEPEDGGYRLYTAGIEGQEQSGQIVLNRLCYLLNSTTGTVKAEIKQIATAVSAGKLDEYVRKDARLIIKGGSPNDLK